MKHETKFEAHHQSKDHNKVSDDEAKEAKVRLLQIENEELRLRVAELEARPSTPLANLPVGSFTPLPVGAIDPNDPPGMPNFVGMTQGQMVTYAKDYGIDLKKCQRADEIVETLKAGWRNVQSIAKYKTTDSQTAHTPTTHTGQVSPHATPSNPQGQATPPPVPFVDQ